MAKAGILRRASWRMAIEEQLPETAIVELPLSSGDTSNRQLSQRLEALRQRVNNQAAVAGRLHRIGVAAYEPDSGMVKTYAASGDAQTPIDHYEISLARVTTLSTLAAHNRTQVVDDYRDHPSDQPHTQSLRDSGLRSGLLMPLRFEGALYGFIFLNSREPGLFRGSVTDAVAPYLDIARLLAINSLRKNRILRGAARTALTLGSARDDETGSHLARMAEFSRITALEAAAHYGLDDEYVEMIHQFAPVHDVGKLAIPDDILRKPGRLTDDEMARMREHVTQGVQMIEDMTANLELGDDRRAEIMRNIVAYHHERLDGSGYPFGAPAEAIPAEGRIVAVADVFDALTSERPYKRAWSLDAAARTLREEAAAGKLCPVCVDGFLGRVDRIEAVWGRHGTAA